MTTPPPQRPYPLEIADPEEDDGTMPNNVAELENYVVGARIVEVNEGAPFSYRPYGPYGSPRSGSGLELVLDTGRKVYLADSDDCCAHTALDSVIARIDTIDHIITGVGTTGNFTRWHIFADYNDVVELEVSWTAGNPFYYGYGFDIHVIDPEATTTP